MATYDYTTLLNPLYPLVGASGRTAMDIEPIIARCLNRVKKSCKGVVAHTLENQVARIQAAKKRIELEITIAQSKSAGIWGWITQRKHIKTLKLQRVKLQESLVKWVCSVYTYFLV